MGQQSYGTKALGGNAGAMFAGLHANHGKPWDAKLILGAKPSSLRAGAAWTAEASEVPGAARARRTYPL